MIPARHVSTIALHDDATVDSMFLTLSITSNNDKNISIVDGTHAPPKLVVKLIAQIYHAQFFRNYGKHYNIKESHC